jgi:hypothetical protein
MLPPLSTHRTELVLTLPPALMKPYSSEWLKEGYFIFRLREIAGSPSAAEVLSSYGAFISQ